MFVAACIFKRHLTHALFLFFIAIVACSPQQKTTQRQFTKQAECIVVTSDSTEVVFDVELATTEYQRTTGLMYRYTMEQNQGMFFIFDRPTPQSFWMKNTYISLDIIFIDENYKIVYIHENAFPLSEIPIICEIPSKYVLELLGGTAKQMNIKVGDVVKITTQGSYPPSLMGDTRGWRHNKKNLDKKGLLKIVALDSSIERLGI